jgi:TctA family transporter
MELFHHLALGFSTALSLQNVLYCFIGALLGTLIGVLPGIGPIATIAMLLPSVYSLDAAPAIIMLAGIYYGAQYGGSTTAILINVPGEATSVVTALDGYQMARQGRAGAALAVAALGSFFAGCVATVVIAAFAEPLTEMAGHFGRAEYFSLTVLGLIGAVVLASGSLVKAIAMIVLGILLGQVNRDVLSGVARFTFDIPELGDADGIGVVGIAMGMFGFAEIISNLSTPAEKREVFTQVKHLWPSREDFRQSWRAVLRGTGLGSLLGVLPGGGALIASFAAYSVEKKLARDPSRFGRGAIEGVASPESANNAGAQTSFIPTLTLGIPPNAVMAMMVAALTIKGVQPGPSFITDHPDLFWGLIASMWVGNLMLVVLNLPLIGIWVKLLSVPYRFLFPAIVAFCCIGLYSLRSDPFDVYVGAAFGLIGHVLFRLGCEPAPLLLGFILGPMMEENLRQALLLAHGDWSTFVTRPLSAGLLATAALLILAVGLPTLRSRRAETFKDSSPP